MTRKTKIHEIRDYIVIALAMVIGSIGLNVFLLPNHITMGGVGGIASILYWGFGIPVSFSYFGLNFFLEECERIRCKECNFRTGNYPTTV